MGAGCKVSHVAEYAFKNLSERKHGDWNQKRTSPSRPLGPLALQQLWGLIDRKLMTVNRHR